MSDGLLAGIKISASALAAQSKRMEVIAQNIANEDSTGLSPGEAGYKRKTIFFASEFDRELNQEIVKVSKIGIDNSPMKMKYDPSHPAANEKGYVLYPNVDKIIELTDAKEASHSYEANLSAIENMKAMIARLLDILRT